MIRGDEHTFPQRFDGPVQLKLVAAIIRLCRWRKHLDDQCRIEQCLLMLVQKLRLSTNHYEIGIDILAV